MKPRAVTPMVPGPQFYRDADHIDAARDELATGPDLWDPEYTPPPKPHPLPPVAATSAAAPEHLLRSGDSSTRCATELLSSGRAAVEPTLHP